MQYNPNYKSLLIIRISIACAQYTKKVPFMLKRCNYSQSVYLTLVRKSFQLHGCIYKFILTKAHSYESFYFNTYISTRSTITNNNKFLVRNCATISYISIFSQHFEWQPNLEMMINYILPFSTFKNKYYGFVDGKLLTCQIY